MRVILGLTRGHAAAPGRDRSTMSRRRAEPAHLRFALACVAAAGLALSVSAAVTSRPGYAVACSRGGPSAGTADPAPGEVDAAGFTINGITSRRRPSLSRSYRGLRERPARRVVSDDQVQLGARRYFLRHSTLDMDALALSMSISRATLYRVVHSRDQLLGDVLWHCAEQMLQRARAQRTMTGIDGVIEVTRLFSLRLFDAEPFRAFLAEEPETAARVLFTPVGNVHRRALRMQKEIFQDAAPPDGPWLTGDLDHLAYLYVRLVESSYYAELLAGIRPNWDLTERAARALLSQAL